MTHKCFECGKVFTRKYNRDRHYNIKHKEKSSTVENNFVCPFCLQNNVHKHFEKKEHLVRHVDKIHSDLLIYKLKNSAFDGKISIFSKKIISLQPLEQFISNKKNLKEILQVILHQLSKYEIIKVAIIVTADYRIPSVKENLLDTGISVSEEQNNSTSTNANLLLAEERDRFSLRTRRESFNVNESKKSSLKKIRHLSHLLLEREEDLVTRGSGWQFEGIHSCDIEIVGQSTF